MGQLSPGCHLPKVGRKMSQGKTDLVRDQLRRVTAMMERLLQSLSEVALQHFM